MEYQALGGGLICGGINTDYKPLVINGTPSILTHIQSTYETNKTPGSAVDRESTSIFTTDTGTQT